MIDSENHILKSRNPAILKRAIDLLDNLYWDILWATHSYLVSRFYTCKSFSPELYNNYKMAQSLFMKAEKAMEEERFLDLKRMVFELYRMMKIDWSVYNNKGVENFKGTGIS
jgi:hypothetical protein